MPFKLNENINTDWSKVKNLLCVRLDNIGDVIMTTPALRALKESVPGRKITLLTSQNAGETAGLIREVDKIITFEAPWMKQKKRTDSREAGRMAEILRKGNFEGAVIFTVYSQSPLPAAFLCHLADIPYKAAYCRENPYQLITHWIKDPEPFEFVRHEVQRQLDLAESIGAVSDNKKMFLSPGADAKKNVISMLEEKNIAKDKKIIAVHPGATAASRKYDWKKFALACRLI